MNRRGILKLLGGAATLGPNLTVRGAAAALGASLNPAQPMPDASGVGMPSSHGINPLHRALWRKREIQGRPADHMPAHIAAPKSWGLGFRMAVWEREREILDAYERMIEEDEGFRDRAMEILFGGHR